MAEAQDKTPRRAKGRKRPGRGRKVLQRVLLTGLIGALVLALVGLGGFIYLYSTTDLPDPHAEFQTQTTFIYYNDGETQLGSLAVQNREVLAYEEIPELVKEAVVAAENRDFWTDPGISISGILRSVWSIVSGGGLQGGSTITQQYIKILYLDSEQTMQRKTRELILAIKMGREMPKEEILTGYLNTIYFGRGAYGIQAASKSYFLKPVDQLGVDEVAVLAAILNNPGGLNPSAGEEHRERLLGRYQYVLDGMLETGAITADEHQRAHPQLPEFPEVPVNERYGGPNGFLINMVERELEEKGFTEAEIQGGGLQVVTTLDKRLQDTAVEVAQRYTDEAATNAPEPRDPANLHIALSSVDTRSGAILALYGGPDFVENSRNWSTTPRHAASTFKAFATVAGLRNGFNLDSRLEGDAFTPPGDASPVNNQGQNNYGQVSLRRALADSINTAFVDMTLEMEQGPEAIIQAAEDAGAHESGGANWEPQARIALGVAEVSPLDMANSYATLVDSGNYKPTHIVAEVKDSRGNTVYQAEVEPDQRIDSNVAANVTDALTSVVSEGTGRRAGELGRPVAGKTGTHAVEDTIRSAWFVGATRQISTAVMYVAGEGGNEDIIPFRRPEDRTFFGSGYPLSTWLDYMMVATEGMEVQEFDDPEPIDSEVRQPSEEASEEPTQEETTEQPSEEPSETATPEETESTPEEPTPTPEETVEESTPEPTTPDPTTAPTTAEPTQEPPVETPTPPQETEGGDDGQIGEGSQGQGQPGPRGEPAQATPPGRQPSPTPAP